MTVRGIVQRGPLYFRAAGLKPGDRAGDGLNRDCHVARREKPAPSAAVVDGGSH